MTKPICIYHANCADGFTAAWAVWRALGDRVEYIPAAYGDEPPDVTDTAVIIVDFSYKRPVLDRLALEAKSILILDHHKTAAADLEGIPEPLRWDGYRTQDYGPGGDNVFAIFDMERSGAQIAWDFFHDAPRPGLVDYVADRDLWRFDLPFSREIHAAIASREQTWAYWDELATMVDDPGTWIVIEGTSLLRMADKNVRTMISASARHMKIGGHLVQVANVPPYMASDTAGEMAKADGAPFAATYYDGPKGRAFSLRSRGEGGADVAVIAASYGGGGHRNAAGFLMRHGWEGDE
jgi:uncharacterized protein